MPGKRQNRGDLVSRRLDAAVGRLFDQAGRAVQVGAMIRCSQRQTPAVVRERFVGASRAAESGTPLRKVGGHLGCPCCRAAPAPAPDHENRSDHANDHDKRDPREPRKRMAERTGQHRPGRRIDQRHRGCRVEVLPPIPRKPDLDPGMGVPGLDVVEVGDRVERPRHVPDGFAGRDAEAPQHHYCRRRDLLAVAAPCAEQERVDGVGPGRQRGDVGRVVDVARHPLLDRGNLVIGVRIAGGRVGDPSGDFGGERGHSLVGVGQLEVAKLLVGPEGGPRVDLVCWCRDSRGLQLRGSGIGIVGHDGVDRALAHRESRGDGAIRGHVDGAGLEVDPLGVVGVEDEVGAAGGQVEGLDVLPARGERSHLVRIGGDGDRRAPGDLLGAVSVDRIGRLHPGLPVPLVECLAYPVVGPGGAYPHDHLVAQGYPGSGVQGLGESEEAAHTGPAGGAGRVSGKGAAPVGQVGRTVDRGRVGRRRGEGEGGRHLRCRQDGDDSDCHHGYQESGACQRTPWQPGGLGHRLPHGDEAPYAARHPGQHPGAQGDVHRLGGGDSDQCRRSRQRVGDVASRRDVERMSGEHPGEEHGQWCLDRGDVARRGRPGHRQDEPGEPADGADSQDGLDAGPRVGASPVGEDVADDRGEHGQCSHGGAEEAFCPARPDASQEGCHRRCPQ